MSLFASARFCREDVATVPVAIEYILFALYVLLGPLAWVAFGIGLFKGRKRMMLVERPPMPLPDKPPRATILIPAKDEGERIRDCIESALGQDYPDFHVIAINDRSTDRTGAILDELAAGHPNLRVLHIREGSLPPGWTGKCNALHTAVKHAEGQWLLFVDSDVVLQPDALRATLAMGEAKQCDVVTLLPKLESHTFWESLLVPLAGCGVSALYLVALTNNNHLPHVAFANGQYLLIRRSVYEAMGGHEAVRDRFCEDVEIARILKPRGYKVRISWASQFAAVRMYSSLPAILRGWGRNFFAGSLGRPWRILLGILFIVLCSYSAYAALGWGVYRMVHPVNVFRGYGWLALGAAHLALMTVFLGIMYTWSGNRRRNALWFPLGGALMLLIFVRSLRMCLTGNVEWRGTRYTHRMDPKLSEAEGVKRKEAARE